MNLLWGWKTVLEGFVALKEVLQYALTKVFLYFDGILCAILTFEIFLEFMSFTKQK